MYHFSFSMHNNFKICGRTSMTNISHRGKNEILFCQWLRIWIWERLYGFRSEVGATLDNAVMYNGNLINMVAQNKVTPLRPNSDLDVYIFALFNENMKFEPSYLRNFGLFQSNGMLVYSIRVIGDHWYRIHSSHW